MSLVAGFILVLIILILYYLLSLKLYWKRRKILYAGTYTVYDGIKAMILQFTIGNMLWKIYNRSDPKADVVGFHLIGKPSVLVKDMELVKRVLVKDYQNFAHRTLETTRSDPVGTRIMFFLRSRAWETMRKKFSTTFTAKRFHTMYPQMNYVGDNLVNYLADRCEKEVSGKDTFQKFSTDLITLTAFGIKANCFKDDNAVSIRAARVIFEWSFYRGIQFVYYFLSPFLTKVFHMKFIHTIAVDVVKDMISEVTSYRKKNNVVENDLVGMIIDMFEKKTYVEDINEIYGQGVQFWLAGFETISTTLVFLFYELGHNLEVQEKLRMEVLTTLGDNNRDISYETVQQMKYLGMTITECLRKYPILPFLDRRCINEYTIPGTDIVIDAGTNMYISIQGIHSNPAIFPDPHKFEPERFSLGNSGLNDAFNYLSFGAGPRHCIGIRYSKLSLMIATLKVISKFRIYTCGKYDNNMEFDKRGFLLSPKYPISFRFEKL